MTTRRSFDVARKYDRFYAAGGWRYDRAKERKFLRDLVVTPAGWATGSKVLELGCGRGDHAALLHELGLNVTAVDLSKSGIASARQQFKGPRYLAADVTSWKPQDAGTYQGIFVRGMSVYHYELEGVNRLGFDVPALTGRFFEWLAPGGVFVLQIATDFTGRRPPNRVHFSKGSAYEHLFRRYGRVFRTTDWMGRALINDEHARANGKRGILIFTRKRQGTSASPGDRR